MQNLGFRVSYAKILRRSLRKDFMEEITDKLQRNLRF